MIVHWITYVELIFHICVKVYRVWQFVSMKMFGEVKHAKMIIDRVCELNNAERENISRKSKYCKKFPMVSWFDTF